MRVLKLHPRDTISNRKESSCLIYKTPTSGKYIIYQFTSQLTLTQLATTANPINNANIPTRHPEATLSPAPLKLVCNASDDMPRKIQIKAAAIARSTVNVIADKILQGAHFSTKSNPATQSASLASSSITL